MDKICGDKTIRGETKEKVHLALCGMDEWKRGV
jgi:hypothetical protein